jgi:hypothetical protein
MTNNILAKFTPDGDLPRRAHDLDMRKRILNGTLYDDAVSLFAMNAYHMDRVGKMHVPEHDRVPAVKVGLSLIIQVIEDCSAFLFGEGRFPTVETTDRETRALLAQLFKETNIRQLFQNAVMAGSIGSTAIQFRVLKSKVYLDLLDTTYLTPFYFADAPDTLEKVVEKYKILGRDLANNGYDISKQNENQMYWFKREFTTTGEIWYNPQPITEDKSMTVDKNRSVQHPLQRVPIFWIKNLPDANNNVDGMCLFDRAVDACIQIDYRISGADRALKYSSDPMLLLKDYNMEGSTINKSAHTAIVVGEKGDAKILEISGQSIEAVYSHVEKVREFVLEVMHAVRASPDKVAAATSGLALKMLYAPVLRVADSQRSTYGDAILGIAELFIHCVADLKLPIKVGGKIVTAMPADQNLHLDWPDWFGASADDLFQKSQALLTLTSSGIMSTETALRNISTDYEIEDLDDEKAKIDSMQKEQDARMIATQTAIKPPTAPKTTSNQIKK